MMHYGIYKRPEKNKKVIEANEFLEGSIHYLLKQYVVNMYLLFSYFIWKKRQQKITGQRGKLK